MALHRVNTIYCTEFLHTQQNVFQKNPNELVL